MLTRIESGDNSKLKLVRKLKNKKARDDEKKFVIEGFNLVEEAVCRNVDIEFILVSDFFNEGSFIDKCLDKAIPVLEVPSALFEKLTDAEFGVGILAVVRRHDIRLEPDKDDALLVLDRVQDPGNMGTMIRTAVAAGYAGIIAVKGTVDVYSAKVLRATAGMIFDIPIVYVDNAAELKELLAPSGHRLAVTVPTGGRAYYEEDLDKGVALVIGNEGNGVSDEVLSMADIRVTIPMCGEIESLNAAVSAAILMYERMRNGKEQS